MWQAILSALKAMVTQLEGFVGTAIHDLVVYVQAVIPAEEATVVNDLLPIAEGVLQDMTSNNPNWKTIGSDAEVALQTQAIKLGIDASITAIKVAVGLAMAKSGITANTTSNGGNVNENTTT
jgi:hypothetical protein